jgi:recombinational DNA repair ATPase RecF
LAAALLLAQTEQVMELGSHRVALLVDEPAADLDPDRLRAYLDALTASRAQLFVAAISRVGLAGLEVGAMFHVEHGHPKALL